MKPRGRDSGNSLSIDICYLLGMTGISQQEAGLPAVQLLRNSRQFCPVLSRQKTDHTPGEYLIDPAGHSYLEAKDLILSIKLFVLLG